MNAEEEIGIRLENSDLYFIKIEIHLY